MTWASVGLSSYPDLRGQEQFTNSPRIADQFWSLATDMQQYLPKGYWLSVNEARRSRPRQSYLWNNRAALGVVVAPPFSSRHDEVTHGNAMDIGMTRMSDGMNFALSSANFDRMHAIAERRGFTWTGRNFGEQWHIEGATRPEELPPYPNARAVADAEYVKYNTPVAAPVPSPTQKEWIDMDVRLIAHPANESGVLPNGGKGGYFVHNIVTGAKAHVDDNDKNAADYIRRLLTNDGTDQMFQGQIDTAQRWIAKVS